MVLCKSIPHVIEHILTSGHDYGYRLVDLSDSSRTRIQLAQDRDLVLCDICDVTPSCMWRDAFICVTWLIHMVCRDAYSAYSGTRPRWSRRDWDHTSHVWMCPRMTCDVCCSVLQCVAVRCSVLQSYVVSSPSKLYDVTHDLFICVTWLIFSLLESRSQTVWRDSFICGTVWRHTFICVTWLIHMWRDVFIRVTWLIHTCDVTHSYVCGDSFICVTHLIRMCDMTRLYVWHGWFIYVTRLIHICDTARSYVWYDSFICVTCLTYEWVVSHTKMSHVSHVKVSCLTYEWVMWNTWMSHVSYMKVSHT